MLAGCSHHMWLRGKQTVIMESYLAKSSQKMGVPLRFKFPGTFPRGLGRTFWSFLIGLFFWWFQFQLKFQFKGGCGTIFLYITWTGISLKSVAIALHHPNVLQWDISSDTQGLGYLGGLGSPRGGNCRVALEKGAEPPWALHRGDGSLWLLSMFYWV